MDRRGAGGAQYAGTFRYRGAGGEDIVDQQNPPPFDLTDPARINGEGAAHIAPPLSGIEAGLAGGMAAAQQQVGCETQALTRVAAANGLASMAD